LAVVAVALVGTAHALSIPPGGRYATGVGQAVCSPQVRYWLCDVYCMTQSVDFPIAILTVVIPMGPGDLMGLLFAAVIWVVDYLYGYYTGAVC
jgi:hypothetical protein